MGFSFKVYLDKGIDNDFLRLFKKPENISLVQQTNGEKGIYLEGSRIGQLSTKDNIQFESLARNNEIKKAVLDIKGGINATYITVWEKKDEPSIFASFANTVHRIGSSIMSELVSGCR
jgi:hypothetical protein